MNTLNGYSKSTLTDNFVLTAAGGHLAVGNAENNIPLNNGTVCTNLNADLLDDKHASSFILISKTTKSTVDGINNSPTLFNVENETLISEYGLYWYVFNMGSYSKGNFRTQIAMPYWSSLTDSELFIRSATKTEWRDWRRVLHSGNSYIKEGTITLNGNSITPLTSVSWDDVLSKPTLIERTHLFSKSDYLHYVVLLCNKGVSNYTRVTGKLYTLTAGSGRYQAADIDFWYSKWDSGSDGTYYLDTYGLGTHWKLVTLTYNGATWFALLHTNIQSIVAYFEGSKLRADFTSIHYYTSNTLTVVNSEIYNSISEITYSLKTLRANITGTSEISKNGIFYIEGSGTTAGKWLGSHSRIGSYYEGLTIAYKIPIEGASTTTLNINNLGAKTIRRNDSALTTHLPVNSIVILVYDGTYFRWSDYDANNYAYVRQYLTTTSLEYPLLFRYNTNAPSSTHVLQYTRYNTNLRFNPSTGQLKVGGCLYIDNDSVGEYTLGIRIKLISTSNMSSLWLATTSDRGYNAGMWGISATNTGPLRFRGGATEVSDLMTLSQVGVLSVPGGILINKLQAPTASNGTTYGLGTNGLVLKSNGTTIYWGSDSNSDPKVTQTVTTSSNTSWRPILLGYSYSNADPFAPATVTNTAYATHLMKIKPDKGDLWMSGTLFSQKVHSSGRLTLNATSTGVDLKFNNDNTKSVILNGTAFKPFDDANDKLTLGSTNAKWSNVYSVNGDFSSDVIATNFGIKSTTGTGDGISLFGGIAHVSGYGIAMVKTATSGWGTHGQVSGDWATYFNMSKNGTNKRGWIFRSDSTNIASIGTGGEITANSYYGNGYGLLKYCTNAGEWTGSLAGSILVGSNTPTVIRSSEDNLYHYNWTKGERYLILDTYNSDRVRKSNITCTSAGWYRIASTPVDVNNNNCTFYITAVASGNHTNVILNALISFNNSTNDPCLLSLGCVSYSACLTKARIVWNKNAYAGLYAHLEIYKTSTNQTTIYTRCVGYGWNTLITTATTGTIPSNYTSKEISLSNGNFVGNLSGNASTASKLATARTISLTGSVTGSASFDGSGNISIATTTNHNHDGRYTTINSFEFTDGVTVADWAKATSATRSAGNWFSVNGWSWASSRNINVGGSLLDRMRYSAVSIRNGNLNYAWHLLAVLFIPTYEDSSVICLAQLSTTDTAGSVYTSVKYYGDVGYNDRRYVNVTGDTMTGTLTISGVSTGNWNEGIRINDATDGWTTLTMGGTATSGTGAKIWSLHTYDGNFYIAKNGSSTGDQYINNVNNRWRINTTYGNDTLNVGGWVATVGDTGWYSYTYGGGIYMTDSAWVRTYGSKSFYCDGTIYAGGALLTASTTFLRFISYTHLDVMGFSWDNSYYDYVWFKIPGTNNLSTHMRLALAGGLYIWGNGVAYHFYEHSDIRYKNVINDINISVQQLAELPIFNFTWTDRDNGEHTGSSALAVQKLLPNLISADGEKLTLDYGVLGTVSGITACRELTKHEQEIQKLQNRISELEEEIENLKNKN